MLLSNKPKQLLCPRCERPLDDHVDGQCTAKKLSRRFFLGFLGTAAATLATSAALSNVVVDSAEAEQLVVTAAPRVHSGSAMHLTGSLNSFFHGSVRHMEDAINLGKIQQQINEVAERGKRRVIATVRLGKGREEILYAEPELRKVTL